MKPILLLLFFLVFTSLLGFYLAIRPLRFYSSLTPAYYKLPYQDVTLQTKDHLKLAAWFVPSKRPSKQAIILLHGYPADKGDILPSRIFLHDDFNLLFLDFRYFGNSEGRFSTVGAKEVLDVQAAVDYLRNIGMTEIGIWGFSLGGSVAIMSAAVIPDIKAIVTESAYANLYAMVFDYYRLPLLKYPLGELTRLWGILFLQIDIKNVSPERDIRTIHIPILLIHSRIDSVIAFKHALILKDAVQHNPTAEVYFVDDLMHGQPIADYETIIHKFFTTHLKPNKN